MRELLIPLFPLEVVLFPNEVLPLHIFEDRYKQMIAECLVKREHAPAEAEFGVVWAQEGDELQAVGCTADVTEVIRRYEDGRLDILTLGRRRFETLFTNSAKPYLRGAVAFFEDDDPDEPAGSEIERAKSLLGEVLRRLKLEDQPPALRESPRSVSFQLAARLPLGLEFKQQILVLRSERERLRRLTDAMERLIPALDFRNKVRAKASGNGHAEPGGATG